MQLFEVLPDNFFSILASKNRAIYAEALFVIRDAFKNEELTISREQVFSALSNHLRYVLPSADFSEEEGTPEINSDEINGKVSTLIRSLKDHGWIDFEYASASSLEENVTIPDYALDVINVLSSLTREKKQEYRGYIFASYAALEIANDKKRDYYNALTIAYKNTNDYIEALKVLYNNIRRYIQRSTSLGVNELLEEHFDNYSIKITKALLDPIKTSDSVQRYKHHILSILHFWQESEDVLASLLTESAEVNSTESEAESKARILQMIDFIIDTYESVEHTIAKIDERHRQYMHLSIDSLRYKMSSGNGTGTLITKLLDASNTNVVLAESLKTAFELSEYPYATSGSLYNRVERNSVSDGSGEAVVQYTENTALVSSFFSELKNQYGSRRVDEFVLSVMEGRREITSVDFPLENNEKFILFLFATLRVGDASCPYDVLFDNGNEEIDVMGYLVPSVTFRQKESKDGL